MKKFYLTSAIPYVNAAPHIGHALEFIQADVISRFHKLNGDSVTYLCGSDENALKNVQSAQKAGKDVQEFIDTNAKLFQELAKKLNIEFDVFQKGSSENHHQASQKLWELCDKTGDIYKKKYKGLYCVGCEEFKVASDLNENSECPEHPGKALEHVEEENYFFKLSKYQEQLINLISTDKLAIVPEFRKKEVLSFLKNNLQDISISRSNERAKNWGVSVPGDPTQKIYVWFDALNIYQSGVGFGSNEENYKKWWPADLHVVGKGIIRFHAIYWPAILLSAGLELPKQIFVHEYFTVNGQKMSKTLGNIIDPFAMIEKYGVDSLRYYCLAKISPFADSDFSEDKLKETYNSDLANGIGNLTSRIAKLCENNDVTVDTDTPTPISSDINPLIEQFRFNTAIEEIWENIKLLDIQLNTDQPWKLEKEKATKVLINYVKKVRQIALSMRPFLPKTANLIEEQFAGPKIVSGKPIFPRIK